MWPQPPGRTALWASRTARARAVRQESTRHLTPSSFRGRAPSRPGRRHAHCHCARPPGTTAPARTGQERVPRGGSPTGPRSRGRGRLSRRGRGPRDALRPRQAPRLRPSLRPQPGSSRRLLGALLRGASAATPRAAREPPRPRKSVHTAAPPPQPGLCGAIG